MTEHGNQLDRIRSEIGDVKRDLGQISGTLLHIGADMQQVKDDVRGLREWRAGVETQLAKLTKDNGKGAGGNGGVTLDLRRAIWAVVVLFLVGFAAGCGLLLLIGWEQIVALLGP